MIKWNQLSYAAQYKAARHLYGTWEVALYARRYGRGWMLRFVDVRVHARPPKGFEFVEHHGDEDFAEALHSR